MTDPRKMRLETILALALLSLGGCKTEVTRVRILPEASISCDAAPAPVNGYRVQVWHYPEGAVGSDCRRCVVGEGGCIPEQDICICSDNTVPSLDAIEPVLRNTIIEDIGPTPRCFQLVAYRSVGDECICDTVIDEAEALEHAILCSVSMTQIDNTIAEFSFSACHDQPGINACAPIP